VLERGTRSGALPAPSQITRADSRRTVSAADADCLNPRSRPAGDAIARHDPVGECRRRWVSVPRLRAGSPRSAVAPLPRRTWRSVWQNRVRDGPVIGLGQPPGPVRVERAADRVLNPCWSFAPRGCKTALRRASRSHNASAAWGSRSVVSSRSGIRRALEHHRGEDVHERSTRMVHRGRWTDGGPGSRCLKPRFRVSGSSWKFAIPPTIAPRWNHVAAHPMRARGRPRRPPRRVADRDPRTPRASSRGAGRCRRRGPPRRSRRAA